VLYTTREWLLNVPDIIGVMVGGFLLTFVATLFPEDKKLYVRTKLRKRKMSRN